MAHDLQAEHKSVSPETARQVDKICDRFEADWKAGWRPRLEDFLGDIGEPERSALLRDLLAVELSYRRKNGESPKLERYLPRFSEHAELIRQAFTASDSHGLPALESAATRMTNGEMSETRGGEALSLAQRPTPSGKTLGRFELIEVVGEGAFGTVYRAKDPQLDRDVALKMPRTGVLVEEKDVARFLREAKASAQLRHPQIVAVYEAGFVDNTYFIASDLVTGSTLKDELKSGRRFTHEKSAKLIAQIASALHYAHTKGIIHRDVKPANVMLDVDGEPHIMDFGLARRTEGDALRTIEGMRLGTPAYMSPEQAQGKSHLADARSDLWSLGVMLYELLTRHRPFEGDEAEVLLSIRVKDPISPRSHDRSIARDLETICLKCLAKDPKDRYATAHRLAEELQHWLRGEPIDARPIGYAERGWRWAKRNPIPATLASAVAFLLAASTIVSIFVARHTATLQHKTALALLDTQNARSRADENAQLAEVALDQARQGERELKEINERLIQALKDKDAAQKEASDQQTLVGETEKKNQQLEHQAQDEMRKRENTVNALKWPSYVRNIDEAQKAWRLGDRDRMLKALDDCPTECQSWEWRYLRSLSQSSRSNATIRFTGQTSRITSIHYDPSTDVLASVSDDGRERSFMSWKVQSGATVETRLLGKSESGVNKPQFLVRNSPGSKSTVEVVETSNDNVVYSSSNGNAWSSVNCVSQDGTRLVFRVAVNEVRVCDTAAGHEVPLVVPSSKSNPFGIERVQLGIPGTPSEGFLAIASSSSALLYNLKTDEPSGPFVANRSGSIWFSPRGAFYTIHQKELESYSLLRWDIRRKSSQSVGPFPRSINPNAFSPDESRLAFITGDGMISIWDVARNKRISQLRAPESRYSAVEWLGPLSMLAAGREDGLVEVLTSLADSGPVSQFPVYLSQHTGFVYAIAFNTDGTELVSAGFDSAIRRWTNGLGESAKPIEDVLLPKSVGSNPSKKMALSQVVMSANGVRVAAIEKDGIVRVHDTSTGTVRRGIPLPENAVVRITCNADGSQLACLGTDGSITIWDTLANRKPNLVVANTKADSIIAMSPVGEYLACSKGNVIEVWNYKTKERVCSIREHTGPIERIAFNTDATIGVSVGHDGIARVWRLPDGAVLHRSETGSLGLVAFVPNTNRLAMVMKTSAADQSPQKKLLAKKAAVGAKGDLPTRKGAAVDEQSFILNNEKISIWDVASSTQLLEIGNASGAAISCFAFSADGKRLAVADVTGQIRLWNVDDEQPTEKSVTEADNP